MNIGRHEVESATGAAPEDVVRDDQEWSRSRVRLVARRASPGGSALVALVALTAALGSLAACLPTGHVDVPVQPRAAGEPRAGTDLTAWLPGAQPARYRAAGPADGNRLGDTPAPADDYSRWDAQLASATTGMPHINEVARRVRYNGVYFEIDVEVNGEQGIERGVVPVTWKMLRAHTPLVTDTYYARVYTSRGRSSGRQVPNLGPEVILPEAFTPELTPVIFDHFEPSFISWNQNFDGWTQHMAEAWQKEMVIHVARAWTPEYVGGVAVASAQASIRASRITGQAALGAAAVPNAAAATRACSGGRCPPSAGTTSAAGGGGGRGANHLRPDPNAQGAHSRFKRDPATGRVTGHAEWQPNPRNPSGFDQAKRVDTQYANPHTHHNKATGQQVPTPHAHDRSAPGGVRPARPDELPQ